MVASSSVSQKSSPPQPAEDADEQARLAAARTALTSSLAAVGASVDADIRARGADAHANAATIARQQQDVTRETAALRKQADALQKVADSSAERIKEIGDVQNWAELLERDLLVLEETARLVEGGNRGKGGGGSRA
ncbi:MAG: hypothetical protein M1832_001685 [Thelocarpon impressellum]|nr:MAG: hypothetical protein M1832_001685 [Thelocarpon impressellum]